MFHICVRLAILVSVVAAALPRAAAAQPTVAADTFVNAVGMNVHLHYEKTLYRSNFPLVMSRLLELGVRHVRDGLVDTAWRGYYDRHNALGAAGIKATFIVSPNQPTTLWHDYPARMHSAFEAYEAPNEYNKSSDPDWASTLTDTLRRLHTLRSHPETARFPVIGPSLTTESAYEQMSGAGVYFDASNTHHYFAGREPGTPGWGAGGYGSIIWNMRLARKYWGDKPIVTTETGYQDLPSHDESVPPEVAGRYMPRVLLEHFRAGVARTFLYELADFPRSGGYGLLNADGSPKPAFRAVKSLMNLLADPGPAFTPRALGDEVYGGPSVRHLTFQKRDGRYFLALWLAVPCYDTTTDTAIAVAPESVVVTMPRRMRLMALHQWQADGSMTSRLQAGDGYMLQIPVTDRLTVIELTELPSAPAAPGVPGRPTATVAGGTVTLAWQAPVDGGTPAGYAVEAATRRDFADALSMVIGATPQITVPGVGPGVYFVRVRAGNATGTSAPSATAEVTVGAPARPQLVGVRTTSNPVTLAWSPVAGADHYVVSAGTAPGASDVAAITVTGSTSLSATAPPGVRLYVRVAAVNALGTNRSNEIVVAVGASADTPVIRAPIVQGSTVTLSWSAVPGATGYLLTARAAQGGAVVASTAVPTTGVQVPNVPRGSYVVTVAALQGSTVGPPSPPVVVTVP